MKRERKKASIRRGGVGLSPGATPQQKHNSTTVFYTDIMVPRRFHKFFGGSKMEMSMSTGVEDNISRRYDGVGWDEDVAICIVDLAVLGSTFMPGSIAGLYPAVCGTVCVCMCVRSYSLPGLYLSLYFLLRALAVAAA